MKDKKLIGMGMRIRNMDKKLLQNPESFKRELNKRYVEVAQNEKESGE